jgi:hypothetical protein
MPTSLDNGRRSPKALLRAVVARLLEPEFVLCLAQSAADGRAVGLT